MAAFSQIFTSVRLTEPDPATLLSLLRGQDATAGVAHVTGTDTYRVKKATAFTGPQVTFVQNTIDTCAASTPQLTAQTLVDNYSIVDRALLLALIDQLNVIRAALPTPKPDITVAQAIAAVRAKAGTL